MFKFGFSSNNVNESEKTSDNSRKDPGTSIEWFKCEKIDPHEGSPATVYTKKEFQCGKLTITHISNEEVIKDLKESDKANSASVLVADKSHSDLVTGIYEGGLKIWECTYDLMEFINDQTIDLRDKRVLDLGCGSGLVGILSCLKGATTIFQDYNSEVVKSLTIPNVRSNGINLDKSEFYSGDWGAFLTVLEQRNIEFDYIFTCETIYNIENYRKLLEIFKKALRKNGKIYLAAKSYYFGVGGSISQFLEELDKEEQFTHTTTWECPGGIKRAIIEITFK